MISHQNTRRLLIILFGVALVVALVPLTAGQPTQAAVSQNNAEVAMQALALVNQWRIEQGKLPLKVNPILEQAALAQASYIAPFADTIQDEAGYHRDAQGRFPAQRLSASPYNWPNYGRPEFIEVGENAADGNVQFAVNFWKSSDVHRKTALSDVYREVGVAAVPSRFGFFFIMNFGARPNVTPVMVTPGRNGLFLTAENSRFAKTNKAGLRVRLFDSSGQPLGPAQAWQSIIALPPTAAGRIFVLFTNGEAQSLTEVDLVRDMAVLPQGAQVAIAPTSAPATTAFPTFAPTAAPTSAPIFNPTTSPTGAPVFDPTATPQPTAIAQATSVPAPVGGPDVLLIYNAQSLTLVNVGNQSIDLTGLVIQGVVGRVSVGGWTAVAAFPVNAFPVKHCLQATAGNVSVAPPSQCKFVRSEIAVASAQVFWRAGDFTVSNGGGLLATCHASAGQCGLRFPDSNVLQ